MANEPQKTNFQALLDFIERSPEIALPLAVTLAGFLLLAVLAFMGK